MCNGDLPACVSYVMLSDPLTGVIDSCELLYGCWELNPNPPKSSQYFLLQSRLSSHHSIIS